MNLELTAEQLEAIEDALTDGLVYDNEGDRDAQCEALAKVRNSLGRTPTSTVESVRAWVDSLRDQFTVTGKRHFDG